MNQETRQCQNCKQDFTIEAADFDFYEKVKTPPPTWCAECREKRRICFRNVNNLYKRSCDLCGQGLISRFSSDKPYLNYCQKCWWGDNWDPLSYGLDYDFNKPFFEQFKKLILATPHPATINSNNINSEWVNHETDDKNCYLNFGGHFNEDSAYNDFEIRGKSCFDNYWLWQSEQCYESIDCERCWKTLFSRDCFDCLAVTLCSDMRNCQNCFGCSGLRNKQYYIFNQPFSKEAYQKFQQENPIGSKTKLERLKIKAQEVWLKTPHKYSQITKCNNVQGCFISESKNISNGWYVDKAEDSKNLYVTASLKDCHDCSGFAWAERSYEMGHCVGVGNSKFSAFIIGGGTAETMGSFNLQYCFSTPTCSNCFGCCNIKSKQYCILNKQYSKVDYEQLVEKIKKQMATVPYTDEKGRTYFYGEFFPPELSPFGYNETNSQDYYPLTKEEVAEQGFNWSDYESETKYEFSDYRIPDDIKEVKDDILEKVLRCEFSGKGYRLIPMELQFYRQLGLPIPKMAPLQRHKDRMAQLLPRTLFNRQCQCPSTGSASSPQAGSGRAAGYVNTCQHGHGENPCPTIVETPYSPTRPETIYCEQCYLKEIA